MVQREIQEIRDTLEAFKAAVELGEVSGLRSGAMGGRMTLFEHALNCAMLWCGHRFGSNEFRA